MYGTLWTAPGEGSTVGELYGVTANTKGYHAARVHLHSLDACGEAQGSANRTNLRLTGRPLKPYDLERIAAATVEEKPPATIFDPCERCGSPDHVDGDCPTRVDDPHGDCDNHTYCDGSGPGPDPDRERFYTP